MPYLQGRLLPPLPQEGPLVRREPLLENPSRVQGLPVLRLDQRHRPPLHLPRSRRLRVLTKSLKVLLPAAGLGVLVGAFIRGPEGIGWIFALLVLSAAVSAIAQQTLP